MRARVCESKGGELQNPETSESNTYKNACENFPVWLERAGMWGGKGSAVKFFSTTNISAGKSTSLNGAERKDELVKIHAMAGKKLV